MNQNVNKVVDALCEWIQKELKNASGSQTESILPAVIEATAKLVDSNHERIVNNVLR